MKKNRVLATLLAAMITAGGLLSVPVYAAETTVASEVQTQLTTPKATTASSLTKVKVQWKKVNGALGYKVYRSTKKSNGYKAIATVTGCNKVAYTDSSVTSGKTYYYKVQALGTYTAQNSKNSAAVAATARLSTPEVTAKAASSTSIKLTWKKVSGATGYTVYRAASKSGKYTKLTATTSPSFTDKKVTSGKTYYYKVVATGKRTSYRSQSSNIVSAKSKKTNIVKRCNITYELDGATNNPLNPTSFIPGSLKATDSFYLEDPPEREGYNFLGWFDSPNTTEWEHQIWYFDASEHSKNTIIYAAWEYVGFSSESGNGWTIVDSSLKNKQFYYSNGNFNLLVRPDNLSGFIIQNNKIVGADNPENHPYIQKKVFMMVDKTTGNKYYAWDGCDEGKAPPQGTMAFSEAYIYGHSFEPEYGYFLIPHTEVGKSGTEYSVKTVTEAFASARNNDGYYLGSDTYYKENGKFQYSPNLPEISAYDVLTPPVENAVLMMAVDKADGTGWEWVPFLDEHKIVVTYDLYADTGGYNNFITLDWCVPNA